MSFAVVLFLDQAAEAAVQALCRRLDQAGLPGIQSRSSLRPHVSLAAWDDLDADRFRPMLAQLAAETSSMPCTLASLGVFPTDEGVVFLAPTATRQLVAVHERVFERLSQAGAQVGLYWVPGSWAPHCTLAIGVPRDHVSSAVGVCHAAFRPIAGRLTQVSVFEIGSDRPRYDFELRPLAEPDSHRMRRQSAVSQTSVRPAANQSCLRPDPSQVRTPPASV